MEEEWGKHIQKAKFTILSNHIGGGGGGSIVTLKYLYV